MFGQLGVCDALFNLRYLQLAMGLSGWNFIMNQRESLIVILHENNTEKPKFKENQQYFDFPHEANLAFFNSKKQRKLGSNAPRTSQVCVLGNGVTAA